MPRADQQAWKCKTCDRGTTQCRHVVAVTGAFALSDAGDVNKRQAAPRQDHLDPNTGKRKLTCLSTAPIPQRLSDHQVYKGQAHIAQIACRLQIAAITRSDKRHALNRH